eukprot:9011375-Alexandrium_andersonii.AAC.1
MSLRSPMEGGRQREVPGARNGGAGVPEGSGVYATTYPNNTLAKTEKGPTVPANPTGRNILVQCLGSAENKRQTPPYTASSW